MRFWPPLEKGRLLKRYKRFLADIRAADGEILTIHCPNTGAMTGCADPGSEVWYSRSDNPHRKYAHTLEVVCTDAGRVGVNTGRANALVAEALEEARLTGFGRYAEIRREAAIPGESGRFDFCLRVGAEVCWVEVKSMTLCHPGGRGAFPDAVSQRAQRHLTALRDRRRAGDRAVLIFCVQHTGIRYATAAEEIDPDYVQALRLAVDSGVEVLAFGCRIEPDEIILADPLPVRL